MREILNRVVAVQKEAGANVIRRREETNATRSLLNTARVMADNPVMLRLKELEALQTIAGKVDNDGDERRHRPDERSCEAFRLRTGALPHGSAPFSISRNLRHRPQIPLPDRVSCHLQHPVEAPLCA